MLAVMTMVKLLKHLAHRTKTTVQFPTLSCASECWFSFLFPFYWGTISVNSSEQLSFSFAHLRKNHYPSIRFSLTDREEEEWQTIQKFNHINKLTGSFSNCSILHYSIKCYQRVWTFIVFYFEGIVLILLSCIVLCFNFRHKHVTIIFYDEAALVNGLPSTTFLRHIWILLLCLAIGSSK